MIGVAFEGKTEEDTLAAILSIKKVPGTQVVYKDHQGDFIGEDGFRRACHFAVNGKLPEIKLPTPKLTKTRTIREAAELAKRKKEEAT